MLFCLYFSHYKYIFHVIKSKATLQKLIYKPISKSVQRQLQGSLQGNLALLSLALLDSSLVFNYKGLTKDPIIIEFRRTSESESC